MKTYKYEIHLIIIYQLSLIGYYESEKVGGSSLDVTLCHFHQLLWHPFFEDLFFCPGDAFVAVTPFLGGVVLTAGFFRIVLDLFEADDNTLGDIVPVLVLYAAEHYGQSGGPIFLGGDVVVLGYCQKSRFGKGPAAKLANDLLRHVFVRHCRICCAHLEGTAENIGYCCLLAHDY